MKTMLQNILEEYQQNFKFNQEQFDSLVTCYYMSKRHSDKVAQSFCRDYLYFNDKILLLNIALYKDTIKLVKETYQQPNKR